MVDSKFPKLAVIVKPDKTLPVIAFKCVVVIDGEKTLETTHLLANEMLNLGVAPLSETIEGMFDIAKYQFKEYIIKHKVCGESNKN